MFKNLLLVALVALFLLTLKTAIVFDQPGMLNFFVNWLGVVVSALFVVLAVKFRPAHDRIRVAANRVVRGFWSWCDAPCDRNAQQ